jgi:hypothetical protein
MKSKLYETKHRDNDPLSFYGIHTEGSEDDEEPYDTTDTDADALPDLSSSQEQSAAGQRLTQRPIPAKRYQSLHAMRQERMEEEIRLESIRAQRESYIKDRMKRCNQDPGMLTKLLARFMDDEEDKKIVRAVAGYDIYSMLPVWNTLEIGAAQCRSINTPPTPRSLT